MEDAVHAGLVRDGRGVRATGVKSQGEPETNPDSI